MPIEDLLAWAWQRWEVKVVHREVKSLAGLGDKQCHHPLAAVASVQFSAWVYAVWMLDAFKAWGLPTPPKPTTRWYPHPKRWTFSTTRDALRQALLSDPSFRHLLSSSPTNWQKLERVLSDFLIERR